MHSKPDETWDPAWGAGNSEFQTAAKDLLRGVKRFLIMRLANKIALVTGAGSGIGRGIACRVAVEGALLVLRDIAEAGWRVPAAVTAGALAPDAGGTGELLRHQAVRVGPPRRGC